MCVCVCSVLSCQAACFSMARVEMRDGLGNGCAKKGWTWDGMWRGSHCGHVRPLSHRGHACPLSHCGHARPLSHCGHARPLSHCGHACPLSHCGHARPLSHCRHACPPSHCGHACPLCPLTLSPDTNPWQVPSLPSSVAGQCFRARAWAHVHTRPHAICPQARGGVPIWME